MWSPWQHYQVTITTLHWRKRTSYWTTSTSEQYWDSAVLRDQRWLPGQEQVMNWLNLPPQVLFVLSASQHNFATVWLFFFFFLNFFFFIYWKKIQLFLTPQLQKQVHLGTVCIVLTVLQGWSLPPQMHTHRARAQLLSITEFCLFFFFN